MLENVAAGGEPDYRTSSRVRYVLRSHVTMTFLYQSNLFSPVEYQMITVAFYYYNSIINGCPGVIETIDFFFYYYL